MHLISIFCSSLDQTPQQNLFMHGKSGFKQYFVSHSKKLGLVDLTYPVLLLSMSLYGLLYTAAVKMEQKERREAEEKRTFQLEQAKQEVSHFFINLFCALLFHFYIGEHKPCELPSVLAACTRIDPASERYGLALPAFASWRVEVSYRMLGHNTSICIF